MPLPTGYELKAADFSPKDMQFIELQKFCEEQIERFYSLPPVFLQDLPKGTLSNVASQDTHYMEHTLRRWIEQTEQVLNLNFWECKRSHCVLQRRQFAAC